MRCPDCNKFASFDTESEPEINADVDEDGIVTGTCRIVNTCAECGTDLTAADLDIYISVEDDVIEHRKTCEKKSLEVEVTGERTDRMENKSRTGKIIKNPRYMKHMYGADLRAVVTCECGVSWEAEDSVEVQGSGMEEQV